MRGGTAAEVSLSEFQQRWLTTGGLYWSMQNICIAQVAPTEIDAFYSQLLLAGSAVRDHFPAAIALAIAREPIKLYRFTP